MPRKLKTYRTSLGFFDLAIAAPSMKAALEAWGSRTHLFHQGFAKETHDPAIVAATMAKPGAVLRRPVGSKGAFSENAKLPKHLPDDEPAPERARPKTEKVTDDRKTGIKSDRAEIIAFEAHRKRRERERKKEEARREKERARRELTIERVESILEDAKHRHEARVQEIEDRRAELDKRAKAENERWEKERDKLEAALHRARE